jgi:hypothetical protein
MNQGHGNGEEGNRVFFYENLDSQDNERYQVRTGTVKHLGSAKEESFQACG